MALLNRITTFLTAVFCVFMPSTAFAHLVNTNVRGFYAGMLHPITSAEHLLPMMALLLLASQMGKQAGRLTILLYPLGLFIGILSGSFFSLAAIFHFANLAMLMILGIMIVVVRRLTPMSAAACAVATGLILGWRSGGDWAASSVGFQFVPGVVLTGFLLSAFVVAWIPRAATRGWRIFLTLTGSGFLMAGVVLSSQLFLGSETGMGRGIGLPTEESLKALVAAPELSVTFVIGAFFAAMVWGAAHALTPGHGKAIVGAYLVGARGTPWHALYLGLTVTVTHTLGVFILGLAATLAASQIAPETLYPWLGVLSGLIVFILGAVMFTNRLGRFKSAGVGHVHPVHHDYHDHQHHHQDHHGHHHHHDHANEHDHHHAEHTHDHAHHHHRHHQTEALSADGEHRHDDLIHYHGRDGHSHLPPGADGNPVTWRSLVALGISGGLLPCPSAMVLLLSAVALHRIGFGLAMVAAFSLGLAGVLTVVGLLFIKGSRWIDTTSTFARASRWVPAAGALLVCLLGGGIAWDSFSKVIG